MSAQQQILAGIKGVIPPSITVAPVITGTATVGQTLSCSTGSWAGTNPSFTYQWQQGTTNISGKTASTYLVEAAYIGVTLRCVVTATNSAGSASANSASTAAVIPAPGQVEFIQDFYANTTTTGTWTAPAGVTSISVVAISPSNCATSSNPGLGGTLAYLNNFSVTPGNTYKYEITSPSATDSSAKLFNNAAGTTVVCGATAGYSSGSGVGTAYFSGGVSNKGSYACSGGGAGGYAGVGGAGVSAIYGSMIDGNYGTGGAGGSGAVTFSDPSGNLYKGGGGGTGLLGQGSNGGAGYAAAAFATGGLGGSGGGSGGTGSNSGSSGTGGSYGGGASSDSWHQGGAIRIIWPGTTRQFPSTNTGNL